jgi:hypothetical protein
MNTTNSQQEKQKDKGYENTQIPRSCLEKFNKRMKYMKQNSVKLNRFEPLASPMEAPAAV